MQKKADISVAINIPPPPTAEEKRKERETEQEDEEVDEEAEKKKKRKRKPAWIIQALKKVEKRETITYPVYQVFIRESHGIFCDRFC